MGREDTPAGGHEHTAVTVLPDSVRDVLAVLVGHGGDIAANVAVRAGIGYSTVTTKLRTLESVGLAERFKADDGRTMWRATPTSHTTPTGGTPADPPDPDNADTADNPRAQDNDADTARAGDSDADSTDAVAEDTAQAQDSEAGDSAQAGDTDAGSAAADAAAGDEEGDAGVGDVAAEDAEPGEPAIGDEGSGSPPQGQPVDFPTGPVVPVPAPPAGATGTPAPAGPVDAADTDAATTAVAADPATAGDGDGGGRRAKGALRAELLAVLAARPGQVFKTGELCRLLDQTRAEQPGLSRVSAGAVANAAYKLVATGAVELALAQPATFRLAGPAGPATPL